MEFISKKKMEVSFGKEEEEKEEVYSVATHTKSNKDYGQLLEDGRVQCCICDGVLKNRKSFQTHRLKVHELSIQRSMVCPVGVNNCARLTNRGSLIGHLKDEHGITCEMEKHSFNSKAEFQTWKAEVERKAGTFFTSQGGNNKTNKTLNFHCHHSGLNKSTVADEKRKRAKRHKGYCAVGTHCPATIHVKRSLIAIGRLEVTAYLRHVGHPVLLCHNQGMRVRDLCNYQFFNNYYEPVSNDQSANQSSIKVMDPDEAEDPYTDVGDSTIDSRAELQHIQNKLQEICDDICARGSDEAVESALRAWNQMVKTASELVAQILPAKRQKQKRTKKQRMGPVEPGF